MAWSDLSIAKKLYLVIGTMAVLLACELVVLSFTMQTLSAVRAFVEGEGSWSKAQKNAALALQRYSLFGNERDYATFLDELRVPEGDHAARVEMEKPNFDMAVVRAGFLQGQIHEADIAPMVDLLRRFHDVDYLARAIADWRRADELLARFKQAGIRYHDLVAAARQEGEGRLAVGGGRLAVTAAERDRAAMVAAVGELVDLNRDLTAVEAHFSYSLGEGSRWLERAVFSLLFLAVLTVETVGLTLTFRTTRALSQGLGEANAAAERIGAGHFDSELEVRSGDELGRLATSINGMRAMLERSYHDLEARVQERTRELEGISRENARLFREADGAVRMRDEFISIASHEFKTPLTALNLQLDLLSRQIHKMPLHDAERARLGASVDVILRQGRRLAMLSTELMDLTRIQLGKLEIRREPCDLASIVRDAAMALGDEAARAGSELEVEAPRPVRGWFDPVRMGQVATNLIGNAIKYGEGGRVDVRVAVMADGRVALAVRDHGAGIASKDQARVFERFERLEGGEARAGGLGLGLYITRQIVELHGGRVRVESEPGAGSTFTVEMPAGEPSETQRV
jgi:signal transduction histidine kinase